MLFGKMEQFESLVIRLMESVSSMETLCNIAQQHKAYLEGDEVFIGELVKLMSTVLTKVRKGPKDFLP